MAEAVRSAGGGAAWCLGKWRKSMEKGAPWAPWADPRGNPGIFKRLGEKDGEFRKIPGEFGGRSFRGLDLYKLEGSCN